MIFFNKCFLTKIPKKNPVGTGNRVVKSRQTGGWFRLRSRRRRHIVRSGAVWPRQTDDFGRQAGAFEAAVLHCSSSRLPGAGSRRPEHGASENTSWANITACAAACCIAGGGSKRQQDFGLGGHSCLVCQKSSKSTTASESCSEFFGHKRIFPSHSCAARQRHDQVVPIVGRA